MSGALGLLILSGSAASAVGLGASNLPAIISGYRQAFTLAADLMVSAALLGAIVIKQKRHQPTKVLNQL